MPAYFTLVFPVFLILNVFFIVFWIAFRKWYFFLSLLVLIITYPSYKNAFALNINKNVKEVSEDSFSLLTYNTWIMGRYQKHSKDEPNKVIQYVLDSDADIVCLQEFHVATQNFITHAEMVRIFKKYPYHHIYYKNTKTNRKSGIATFSKYPIIKKVNIDYQSRQNASIYSDIKIKGDTIRLINCHLESNNLTEKDKSLPAEIRRNFDAENISNVAVQLSSKLGTAYKARALQADTISQIVRSSPYKTLVCGDFNDVPLSYAYNTVKGDLNDVFIEKGFGFGSTFNENFYKFRIDYVFYDQNFIPLQLKMDKVKYSDHYPLLCRFKIHKESEEQIETK
ncbi:endonuclease/exonuclease/phosphatase family protein [Paludibacteraceae bacterium OttesenSCG-928-F17]|nr:endonuclease/exonuclease/phosphatase family protein [Paludibacteraceae bacterium OttesenSCG-928-F17]